MSTETQVASGLKRTLKLRHIVFIGLAYMAPLAVFDTFGIAAEASGGHVPMSYIVVLIAVVITAFGYAKMVRFFPSAGSAYTYARETIHPHIGFLVGWASTLAYLFLPMLNALLSAIYMGSAFPDVPPWVWIVATIVICTGLNLAGVRFAARVNLVLVLIQVVVAVSFLVFVVKAILDGPGASAFSFSPFLDGGTQVPALAAGAAILALSFLGFDAVSTLAEEAEHPKRDIPRAIFIIVTVAGAFFITVTYLMQTLFPDVSLLEDVVGASPEIAKYIGGAAFQAFFLGGYLVAVLGCGITQQMSAARLLFAMGRDRVLPHRFFARVAPRSGVPVANILLIGLLACAAIIFDLGQAASVINFGAFIAFAAVNLSVVFVGFRTVRGRGPRFVLGFVLFPLLGVAVNIALFASLDTTALLIGAGWMILGVLILLWNTHLFRIPPPPLREPSLD
jgi:putrescine importer